jgi:hypothetical protein
MKQEQVRPVRHARSTRQEPDHDADELWPRSAREFLRPPGMISSRKGFRYDGDKPRNAGQG